MEIPKAKLLRLPFSRKHYFSFCRGVGRFSHFFYFYSLATPPPTPGGGEKIEQIITASIFSCLVSFSKVPNHWYLLAFTPRWGVSKPVVTY